MIDASGLTLKTATINGSSIPSICNITTNTGFGVFGSVYQAEFAKSTTGTATIEFNFPPDYNNYIAIAIHAYSYVSNGYTHDKIVAVCNGLPTITADGVNSYVTNASLSYLYSTCTYSNIVSYGIKYNGSLVSTEQDFIPLSSLSLYANFTINALYSKSTYFRIESINILYFG